MVTVEVRAIFQVLVPRQTIVVPVVTIVVAKIMELFAMAAISDSQTQTRTYLTQIEPLVHVMLNLRVEFAIMATVTKWEEDGQDHKISKNWGGNTRLMFGSS